MKPIRVVVHGAMGKMGREIINALCQDPETKVVGAVEKEAAEDYLTLPDGSGKVPFSSDLERILTTSRPDVLVDFTTAKATMPAVRIVAKQGVNLVIGNTGLTTADLDEIKQLSIAH